jgi:hypothetical protein
MGVYSQVVKVVGLMLVIHCGLCEAQQSDGKGGCITDAVGQIYCSPPSGGILKNLIGTIVCGVGQCSENSIGQIMCSTQSGGYSAKNILNQIVCTGGCEQASQSKCQQPK